MAVKTSATVYGEDGLLNISWPSAGDADTFAPVTIPKHVRELTIQVVGTFGGATISLEGSNDGTNYAVLQDVANANIAIANATKIWRFANAPQFVQPVSAGGTGQALSVLIHGMGA